MYVCIYVYMRVHVHVRVYMYVYAFLLPPSPRFRTLAIPRTREITANEKASESKKQNYGNKIETKGKVELSTENDFFSLSLSRWGKIKTRSFQSVHRLGANRETFLLVPLLRVFLASRSGKMRPTREGNLVLPLYTYPCITVHACIVRVLIRESTWRKLYREFARIWRIVWIHSWLHFRFCFYTKPIFTVHDRERKRCQSETKLSSNVRTRATVCTVSVSYVTTYNVSRSLCFSLFRVTVYLYINYTPGKPCGIISVLLKFPRNNVASLVLLASFKARWPPPACPWILPSRSSASFSDNFSFARYLFFYIFFFKTVENVGRKKKRPAAHSTNTCPVFSLSFSLFVSPLIKPPPRFSFLFGRGWVEWMQG